MFLLPMVPKRRQGCRARWLTLGPWELAAAWDPHLLSLGSPIWTNVQEGNHASQQGLWLHSRWGTGDTLYQWSESLLFKIFCNPWFVQSHRYSSIPISWSPFILQHQYDEFLGTTFFFFYRLDWVLTQGFTLAKQVLYNLSHASSPV
jgi:hypothetical protein